MHFLRELFRSRQPFMTLAGALFLTSPVMAEIGDHARARVSSPTTVAIPWLSGGIGDESREEMRQASGSYNVLVVFSDPQGSYLAAIPFAVTGPAGDEIVAGVSDGPLLYLRLPAATYRLAVQIDGVWQSRRIQPGTGRQPLRLTFVGRRD